jgi:hypothetical protein
MESEYADESQRAGYEAKRDRLLDLMNRPGWKDFCDYVLAQVAYSMHAAGAAKEPHHMAVAVGAANALNTIVRWPELEVKAVNDRSRHQS